MATKNFFDLLGDDENEDPSQVVLRANTIPAEVKSAASSEKKLAAPMKMSSKHAAAEAVKDSPRVQYDGARGGRGGGRVGRSGRGLYSDRDSAFYEGGYRERHGNERSVGHIRDADGFLGSRSSFIEKPLRLENGEGRSYEGGRGGGRGRGRGGRGNGEGDERSRRREFDRHSGNTRGIESDKRAGAGRGNWGTEVDPAFILDSVEATKDAEAPLVESGEDIKPDPEISTDTVVEESAFETVKEEEEDDNEMTLEEYEKLLEEKRKVLGGEKASERKVEVDKAFESMLLVDNKKREEDIFIKLGQDKEKVKREAAEREEKSRKPVSINEFLKPAQGEKHYFSPPNRGRGGRGRGGRADRGEGSGRGDRDSIRGTFGSSRVGGSRGPAGDASAPKIEDQAQFPTLGGK